MISVSNSPQLLRAEDLYQPGMPDSSIELIEGEPLMTTPSSWRHNKVARQFQRLFHEFCAAHPGLDYGGEPDGFLLQRNPDLLLCPDAALFRARPGSENPWLEFAPEIAVEVLSPSNSPSHIALKRRKYFAAGSEQVWIIDIDARTFEAHYKDGRIVVVQGDETFACEGIVEGLEIGLRDLFKVLSN